MEVFLDDGESKAKDQVVHESKVMKKELDPSWNESSQILYVPPAKAQSLPPFGR